MKSTSSTVSIASAVAFGPDGNPVWLKVLSRGSYTVSPSSCARRRRWPERRSSSSAAACPRHRLDPDHGLDRGVDHDDRPPAGALEIATGRDEELVHRRVVFDADQLGGGKRRQRHALGRPARRVQDRNVVRPELATYTSPVAGSYATEVAPAPVGIRGCSTVPEVRLMVVTPAFPRSAT